MEGPAFSFSAWYAWRCGATVRSGNRPNQRAGTHLPVDRRIRIPHAAQTRLHWLRSSLRSASIADAPFDALNRRRRISRKTGPVPNKPRGPLHEAEKNLLRCVGKPDKQVYPPNRVALVRCSRFDLYVKRRISGYALQGKAFGVLAKEFSVTGQSIEF